MFSDLLVNPGTSAKLERFIAEPSHALLLLGPSGGGKLTLARYTAASLLNVSPDKLNSQPYYSEVSLPEKKQEIPIEAIRELTKSLRLQVPGRAKVKRVVLIENAHLMTLEAQNALLKSLEEPAPGTIFILTTTSKNNLLPTVASRTAGINVEPVSLEAANKFYASQKQPEVAAAWALSQGAVGLMNSLLSGEGAELRQAVDQAKSLLNKSRYERLVAIDALSGNKIELSNLLDGLSRVFKALYRAAAAKNDAKRMQTCIKAFRLTSGAQNELQANTLPRLVVLNLVLKLPL